ncbi:hypothetical protein AHAS_Ahas17G0083800 [Arachis hypogaea]
MELIQLGAASAVHQPEAAVAGGEEASSSSENGERSPRRACQGLGFLIALANGLRLYVRGSILGYKRSKSNQYPNTSLIQIEGVNTKEEVAWYAGKRMAYIYKAKVKKNGSHYRCIWGKVTRPHGNSGIVRAKFKSNLPPKSMVIFKAEKWSKGQSLHVSKQYMRFSGPLVGCSEFCVGIEGIYILPVKF